MGFSSHSCLSNLLDRYSRAPTTSREYSAGAKNLRWHLAQPTIAGTLPSYLRTMKLRSAMAGTVWHSCDRFTSVLPQSATAASGRQTNRIFSPAKCLGQAGHAIARIALNTRGMQRHRRSEQANFRIRKRGPEHSLLTWQRVNASKRSRVCRTKC